VKSDIQELFKASEEFKESLGLSDDGFRKYVRNMQRGMRMKIKLLDENCKPFRAYPTDSGLDLRARTDSYLLMWGGETKVIPVGIAIELPSGYEAQIRPRSGLSKQGVIAIFGTVDNSYRGEIKVTLINTSSKIFDIKPYERIAQLVITPVTIPNIEYVDKLSKTDRGDKGHGSTGRI
jgi:dUTP pyrophosphatase